MAHNTTIKDIAKALGISKSTVSPEGLITAKSEGVTVIGIQTDDMRRKAEVEVTVTPFVAENPITSITLDRDRIEYDYFDDAPDEPVALKATIVPAFPTISTLEWTSSDAAVATLVRPDTVCRMPMRCIVWPDPCSVLRYRTTRIQLSRIWPRNSRNAHCIYLHQAFLLTIPDLLPQMVPPCGFQHPALRAVAYAIMHEDCIILTRLLLQVHITGQEAVR